jgi:hypothetical protein
MTEREATGTRSRRHAGRATLALASLALVLTAQSCPEETGLPFERTELRDDCEEFNRLRNPYFGETHAHTGYSFDAIVNGTRTEPRDAYAFARGEPLGLPPFDAAGNPGRVAELRRPLDFAIVTDHAETFGEVDICTNPELQLPGFDSDECERMRGAIGTAVPNAGDATGATAFFGLLYGFILDPQHIESICGIDGEDCRQRASLVWRATQAQAEEFYDRSAACSFTTFVGYEWTATPYVANLHRNVVFRNARVPDLPTSYVEAPVVEDLWQALQQDCLAGIEGCDVLTIPHNSNVSLGWMFAPESRALPDPPAPVFPPPPPSLPLTAEAAAQRAALEPLVEITQHKGDSECAPGILSNDEQCGYEKLSRLDLRNTIPVDRFPSLPFGPLAFVRNALKEGLVQEERLGVNPFQLGLIGSTDTHNGTPGAVREDDYTGLGHLGTADATPAFQLTPLPIGGVEANPGGLAVVWAEENSRDALFQAMRRREVYGTSGTRPIVRFFGGFGYSRDLCQLPDFVERADRDGVPMGGILTPADAAVPEPGASAEKPRFAALALMDPGAPGAPGTPLQRIQIVKGWLDANGDTREQVFDVAGDPQNGADVDLATCEPEGPGFELLCSVWEDRSFVPDQRAFYYARVLENPTCRWSTRLCNELQVDCSDPASVPSEYTTCCDGSVPTTIQERAWTSPIWYRPDA